MNTIHSSSKQACGFVVLLLKVKYLALFHYLLRCLRTIYVSCGLNVNTILWVFDNSPGKVVILDVIYLLYGCSIYAVARYLIFCNPGT